MSTSAVTRRRVATTPDWYEPYAISQAMTVGNLVFVSGQAGIDESGRTAPGGFDAQARQALRNLDHVLQAAGSGLAHVVKVTIFVTDMAVIDQVIALRREFFPEPFPADTIAQVASLASPDWQIEIEAIAIVSG
jgi:2-iminobutanoate/2-iminopropanoate deaminase